MSKIITFTDLSTTKRKSFIRYPYCEICGMRIDQNSPLINLTISGYHKSREVFYHPHCYSAEFLIPYSELISEVR